MVRNKPVDRNGTYNCHVNCDAVTLLVKTHRAMLANISIIVSETAEKCTNVSVCTYTLQPTTVHTEVNIATIQAMHWNIPSSCLIQKHKDFITLNVFFYMSSLMLIIIEHGFVCFILERKRRKGRQNGRRQNCIIMKMSLVSCVADKLGIKHLIFKNPILVKLIILRQE